MKRFYYMHTLNGKLAHFNGVQTCYFPFQSPQSHRIKGALLESLRDIRRQQRATLKYRKKKGFRDYDKMGWVKIPLPFISARVESVTCKKCDKDIPLEDIYIVVKP